MMKRTIIGWLFVCFAIAMSAQNLKFKDGKFKIIQFTDLHYKLGNPASRQATDCLYEIVKAEHPDLIVLTGDVIYSKPGDMCLQQILNIMSDLKVPFCYLLGNHDPEQGTPVTQLYDQAQQNTYCVQPKRNGNALDFALPIKSSDGAKTAAVIYGMDTHEYCKMPGVGGYQWLTWNQIGRYRDWAASFKRENGGKPVPALMFMHYPLPEYNDAVANT